MSATDSQAAAAATDSTASGGAADSLAQLGQIKADLLSASTEQLVDFALEAALVVGVGSVLILVASRLASWYARRNDESESGEGLARSVVYIGIGIMAARLVYIFEPAQALWRVTLLTVIGFPALMVLSRLAGRIVGKHHDEQAAMIARRGIFYIGLAVLVITVMQNLGFHVTALLGTAGLVGVAFGFASQTSLSNFISGLFLISEKPFKLGDVISVSGVTGVVHSIDMLSVKLRTFDNKFVRIPNESMIKTEVTNITRFPIRRHDIQLNIALKEDPARVIDILRDVAEKNTYVLDEPEPFILFTGFGESSQTIHFGVWFAKDDFLEMRKTLTTELKYRLDAEGIEIPFPHRTLYTGSASEPFPITLVNPPENLNSAVPTAAGED